APPAATASGPGSPPRSRGPRSDRKTRSCVAFRLSSTRSRRNERSAVYVAISAATRPTRATAATAGRRRARNDSLTAAPASGLRFPQGEPDDPARLDEERTEPGALLPQVAIAELGDV